MDPLDIHSRRIRKMSNPSWNRKTFRTRPESRVAKVVTLGLMFLSVVILVGGALRSYFIGG